MERVYFVCAGHFTGILLGLLYIRWRGYILCVQAFWWVCCLSDGEGIFCVCRSPGRHSGVLAVYLMDSCLSDGEGIFCVCRSPGRHSGGFAVYLMERVYSVCAGHFAGILVGLQFIWWRGYILCVQAFWCVSCISDGEGIFCVCRSPGRHSGGFAVYLMERVYFVCAGHWWVCCISDGEGIFCVCRSLGRHSGVLAVYLMDSCLSDGEGIFCVCRSPGRHSSGFAVYLTERAYFVCAGHLAGILVGLLYIKGPLKPLMDSFMLPASGLSSHCSQRLDTWLWNPFLNSVKTAGFLPCFSLWTGFGLDFLFFIYVKLWNPQYDIQLELSGHVIN